MNKVKRGTFLEGLIWNYASVVMLALGGFVFNFLITLFYTPDVLGIFNQTYSYYILFSQVAVMGIHMATLRYISQYAELEKERTSIFSTAVILTFLISAVVTFCIEICIGILMIEFPHNRLLTSLFCANLGLLFFSINKVIINFLNGIEEMKAYAVFQTLRNIFISIAICSLAFLQVEGEYISFCFPMAEGLLLLCELVFLVYKKYFKMIFDKMRVKELILFGKNILLANLVLEFNTKIDIICLGLVLGDDYIVGIYSFAAVFMEGFYQLFVVIRRSINPKITQMWTINKKIEITDLLGKIGKYVTFISYLLAGILCLVYYMFCMLVKKEEYLIAIGALIIVSFSMALNGKSIILGNILSQTGFPKQESILNLTSAMCNLILNIIFISIGGIFGAAAATAISYFVYAKVLELYGRKYIKLKEERNG